VPIPFTPVARSVFSPMLMNSEALLVSEEQKLYIRKVLSIASSDEQFAEKAYRAIEYILTSGPVVPPVLTSLNPNTATIGDPYFDIHVMGEGFTPESKIIFNNFEEPTTFVSENELTTGINMPLWLAPAVVPVFVSNADGSVSESLNFTFSV